MRVTGAAVIAVALLGGLAACSSTAPPAASGPTDPGTPSATSGVADPTSAPPAPATPTATPQPTKGGTVGGPGDDELPGPLPFPDRAVSGTVQRLGDCTVLVAGQRRWALTGPMAATLKVGQKVSVSGPPTKVPDGCSRQRDVFQAIQVQRATSA